MKDKYVILSDNINETYIVSTKHPYYTGRVVLFDDIIAYADGNNSLPLAVSVHPYRIIVMFHKSITGKAIANDFIHNGVWDIVRGMAEAMAEHIKTNPDKYKPYLL